MAQIATFHTLKSRAAVRDVCRVLGKGFSLGDRIAKLIPGDAESIEEELDANSGLQSIYRDNADAREILDASKPLQGLVRGVGMHAAGVVVAAGELAQYAPVYTDGNKIVVQFDKDDAEAVGLVKWDILGLKTLSVIESTTRMVAEHRGVHVDMQSIDFSDAKSLTMLAKAIAVRCFNWNPLACGATCVPSNWKVLPI